MVDYAGQQTFGDLVARHRRAARLTQELLAERARMSVVSVSALERGTRRAPRPSTIALLADALALTGTARREFEAAGKRADGSSSGKRNGAASYPQNLPWQTTSFIGRVTEVAEIMNLVKHRRLVTITGPGGIGKTRTCLQVAEQAAEDWRDGVWFVDLAPLSEGSALIGKIASALGVRLPAGADPFTGLANELKPRRILVILDNCEHLVAAARDAVHAIVPNCPQVTILVTSREHLDLPGELVYRLPELEIPAPQLRLSAAESHAYASVALFAERAARAERSFVLTDGTVGTVIDICRRLDGLPLAIELAAAQLPILGLADLHAQLGQRWLALSAGRSVGPDRQQTLMATIAWSFALLGEHERLLFRRLAVFVDGWTLEAAEAVCADAELPKPLVLDALSRLVEKSLVLLDFDDETPRYRLLTSTRVYAGEKLLAAGETPLLGLRHLLYFRELFERAGAAYIRTLDHAIIAALEVELENARTALTWSMEHGHAAAGAELFVATHLWYYCGLFAEDLTRAEAFLALVGEADPRLTVRLRSKLANVADLHGQTTRALDIATRALADARRCDDPAVLTVALGRYALAASRARLFTEAETAFAAVEILFDEVEKRRLTPLANRASLWEARARNALLRNDLSVAARLYERLRDVFRAAGNRFSECIISLNLAEVVHARGETGRAIELVREILPIAEQLPGSNLRASLRVYLAAFLVAVNDTEAALAAARNAIALLLPAEMSIWIAHAMETIALALLLEGASIPAARLAGYSQACIGTAEHKREHTEQTTHDRLVRLLRQRVSPVDLEPLLREGAMMTLPEAMSLAGVVEPVR